MRGERPALPALTLAALPGIGAGRFRALVDRFGSPDSVLGASGRAFAAAAGIAAGPSAEDRRGAARRAARIAERSAELGAHLLVYGAPGYPPALNDLRNPPPVLFVLGRADLLLHRCVAIVGSRRATAYGRRIARGLGASLAGAGRCVVSGMAMGIDAEAHRGALPGPTVAVLGSGVDVPSPPRNRALYGRIVEAGAIVSEFPPGSSAEPHHFPLRNRIIAALARDVIVVEASTRSGALITAEIALDLGREVHAVPGPIDHATAAGTNRLIADGAGVILEIGGPLDDSADPAARLPAEPELRELLLAISAAPVGVEEVAARIDRAPEAVAPLLTMLEIRGFLTPTRDGRVMRTPGRIGALLPEAFPCPAPAGGSPAPDALPGGSGAPKSR